MYPYYVMMFYLLNGVPSTVVLGMQNLAAAEQCCSELRAATQFNIISLAYLDTSTGVFTPQ